MLEKCGRGKTKRPGREHVLTDAGALHYSKIDFVREKADRTFKTGFARRIRDSLLPK